MKRNQIHVLLHGNGLRNEKGAEPKSHSRKVCALILASLVGSALKSID